MSTLIESTTEPTFFITDQAARRLLLLMEKETEPCPFFRIAVLGGGCSGFQYDMKFVNNKEKDDHLFIHLDVNVIIDSVSWPFLQNSTLDYVETLASSAFTIVNPQASAQCGCGNSFSV